MAKKTVTAWVGIDQHGYVLTAAMFRYRVIERLWAVYGDIGLAKRRREKSIRIVKAKITWEDK